MACTFCDIIAGKIPSFVVCEGKFFIGFLPKKMEVYGHTIVVPRLHRATLFDMDDKLLKELCMGVKKTAEYLHTSLNSDGINILHASGISAGQSANHMHIHILPRFKNDGINAWPNLPERHLHTGK